MHPPHSTMDEERWQAADKTLSRDRLPTPSWKSAPNDGPRPKQEPKFEKVVGASVHVIGTLADRLVDMVQPCHEE